MTAKLEGSSAAAVEINSRQTQTPMHVSAPSEMKPFHARPPHLRLSFEDEFTMQILHADDLGFAQTPEDAAPTRIILHKGRVSSSTGAAKWECRVIY